MTVRADRWCVVMAIALAEWMGAACALRSSYTYVTQGFDINRYRTYAWAANLPRAVGDPRLDGNEFLTSRLQATVDRELATRGLTPVVDGADLTVRCHVNVTPRLESTAVRDEPGVSRSDAASVYDSGTLMIDLMDAHTGALVWRGWVEGSVDGVAANQAWLEETVDRAVVRIFESLASRR